MSFFGRPAIVQHQCSNFFILASAATPRSERKSYDPVSQRLNKEISKQWQKMAIYLAIEEVGF
jgi:hypothetical protein